MSKFVYSALLFALATTGASAQTPGREIRSAADGQPATLLFVHHEETDNLTPTQFLTSIPSEVWTVTDWYKKSVYDLANNKIGEINDVLVDHDGKNTTAIIGLGGFLGVGEKDVAVPLSSVHFRKKDNGWYPIMNTTKDALKAAPGYKYDRNARTWIPKSGKATTGGPDLLPNGK